MTDLLDVDLPGQPLRDERDVARSSTARRGDRGRGGGPRPCCRPPPRSPRRRGGGTDWIDDTVDGRARAGSNRPWTGGAASTAKRRRNSTPPTTSLKTIGASEPAKQRARGQIREARAALDLLKGEVDDVNQGDFYPYRYFASEGFLPGYSFPRLPLAAFIPAERKTRNGQGDYVQRPRFLAISEFGPGAFIYHEGARYEVNRVSLPARDDGTGVNITEIKRCERLRIPARQQRRRPATRSASTAAPPSLLTMSQHDATAGRQDPPPRPDQRRRGGTPARRPRDHHRHPVRALRRAIERTDQPAHSTRTGTCSPN